ncbi:hypothetical protein ACHAXS_008812 [Conticribra weissflogii]
MARTFLIHVSLHWSDRGVNDLALWSFAVKHSTWLYNRVPNRVSGLSPIEIATHTKTNHKDLLRTHVWGCPFLGFSDKHLSLAANVRNLTTGYILPQFHLVFNDLFETVYGSGGDNGVYDDICNQLFESDRDWYVDEEFDVDGELICSPPPLDDVWLSEPERRNKKERLARQREWTAQRKQAKWVDKLPNKTPPNNDDDAPPTLPPCNVVSNSDSDSSDDNYSVGHHSESEGEVLGDSIDTPLPPVLPPEGDSSSRQQRPCTQWDEILMVNFAGWMQIDTIVLLDRNKYQRMPINSLESDANIVRK